MPKPNYQFRTKHDGVRMAKRVYVCSRCDTWHMTKVTQCQSCGQPVIHFPSKPEAKRYAELKLLERHGKIERLELQPSFPIDVNGVKVTTYRADFAYTKDDQRIIEDVKPKGFMTDLAKLKIKLASATYGVEINIIERS